MSLEEFTENPWLNSHPAYEKRTFFHIRPAPEFATAEVMVSSLYRACGFNIEEKAVPAAGREFARASQMQTVHAKTGSKVEMDTWRTVINAVLESPKQPNQSAKRFLQMCPLVPDVALYSGSARLSGNSWDPGQLVQRAVAFGGENDAASAATWQRTFDALSVTSDDDIWARWLQHEFELRRRIDTMWSPSQWSSTPSLPDAEKARVSYPARQFVRDLESIILAKPYMTRRQWVSLLEALVRLGSVAHVLWLCEVNHRVWQAVRGIVRGADTLPVIDKLVTCDTNFLTYGNPAVPRIRDYASQYLVARLGINAVLWQLELLGAQVSCIGSLAELETFLAKVVEKRSDLKAAGIEETVLALQEGEKNARTIACKKGIGSNLIEFARYVLGQRQTASETLRGYDQGYVLRKRAEYSGAPWIVSMGPVAILALVHCCLRDAAGPRSIQKLCHHLGQYGIGIHHADVITSDLGRKLRTLGLVLDSPDAESGMLLIPPFDGLSRPRKGVTP